MRFKVLKRKEKESFTYSSKFAAVKRNKHQILFYAYYGNSFYIAYNKEG